MILSVSEDLLVMERASTDQELLELGRQIVCSSHRRFVNFGHLSLRFICPPVRDMEVTDDED